MRFGGIAASGSESGQNALESASNFQRFLEPISRTATSFLS
jgi:hypothetical protein